MWKEVANRSQHKQQERDGPLSAIDNDGENEKRELQNRIDNQDSLDCPNLSEMISRVRGNGITENLNRKCHEQSG